VPSAYSAGVKVLEKDLLQVWQKYSCGDMFASFGHRYKNSKLAADLIQTATAIATRAWQLIPFPNRST